VPWRFCIALLVGHEYGFNNALARLPSLPTAPDGRSDVA
jgi:hypothetical protein